MSTAKPVHRVRDTCRACGARELERCLDLGRTALANSFLKSAREAEGEARYPLAVYLCPRCALVQLADVIDPDVLFRDYVYVTGTSDTIAEHNRDYARAVVGRLDLSRDDLVVEAASNDGSLLSRFRELGVRTLGIEPARNIAARASAQGIETLAEFFTPSFARELARERGPAAAVIANNVLAHVDEPVEFLRAAAALLAPDGQVIVEVPQLHDMLANLEYDTVYHEHLSYFSVSALMRVCAEAGLRIARIDEFPVHGGSVRMWAAPRERLADHAPEVQRVADGERRSGLTSPERLRRFARDVEQNREAVLAFLRSLKAQGLSVAGYGAPAKGNTLLNYCGITTELLPFTVDKSPYKVGLLTPGQHIPVLSVETLRAKRPDVVLILAWNFAAEIVRQQAALAALGTRFAVPIPEPRYV